MYKMTDSNLITKEILENCSYINVNNLLNNFDEIININNFNIDCKWKKDFLIPFLNEVKEPFEKYKEAKELTKEHKQQLLKYKSILLTDLITGKEKNNVFQVSNYKSWSEEKKELINECLSNFKDFSEYVKSNPYSSLKTLLLEDSLKQIPFILSDNSMYVENENRFTNIQSYCIYNDSNFDGYIEALKNIIFNSNNHRMRLLEEKINKITVYDYLLTLAFKLSFEKGNKVQYVNDYFNANYGNCGTREKKKLIKDVFKKYLVKEDLSIEDYNEFKKIKSLDNIEDHTLQTFLNWFLEEYIQPNKSFTSSTILYKQPESLKDFYENHLVYNQTFLKNLYSTEKAVLFNKNPKVYNNNTTANSSTLPDEFIYFIKQWNIIFLEPFFKKFHKDLYNLIRISCLTTKKRNISNLYQNKKIFCKENVNILNRSQSLISTFDFFPFGSKSINRFYYENSYTCNDIVNKKKETSFIKSKIFNKMNLYSLKEYETHIALDEKEIFSFYSKEIVDLFKLKAIHLDENLFKDFNPNKILFKIKYETLDEKEKNKTITLNSNTSELIDSNQFNNEMKNYLKETFENSLNRRIKVIYVPGLNNQSKKKELRIQNTTFKTILKKDGFMIPVFIPFIHLDKNNKETLSWNFTFITYLDTKNNCKDFLDTRTSFSYRLNPNPINQFDIFFENLYSYNQKLLLDPESFWSLKNKKFENFTVFSKNIISYIQDNNISHSRTNKIIKEMNEVTNIGNDQSLSYVKLFDKVKTDNETTEKLERIKIKYKNILKEKNSHEDHIKDIDRKLIAERNGLEARIEVLEKAKIEIKKLETQLAEDMECQTLYDLKFEKIKNILNVQKEIYEKDYIKNLNENNIITNAFLKNTLKNNINVTSLMYRNIKNNSDKLFIYNMDNFETLKRHSSFKSLVYDLNDQIQNSCSYTFDEVVSMKSKIRMNEYELIEVQFNTLQPNLIKIDSSDQYVVGGPYRIKVTATDLYIALLNSKSVFGKNKNEIKVHPHSGGMHPSNSIDSFVQALLTYKKACLGEACSLLYQAFKENDLNKILISSMIWVKSTNSSDFWGRQYKWFPKPEEVNYDFMELTNIPTLSEIDSFLKNENRMIIEEVEEEIIEEVVIEEVEEVFSAITNEEIININSQQNEETRNIENFNTNEGYRRYTS